MPDGLYPASAETTERPDTAAANTPPTGVDFVDIGRTGRSHPWAMVATLPVLVASFAVTFSAILLTLIFVLGIFWPDKTVSAALDMDDLTGLAWLSIGDGDALLSFIVLMVSFPPLIAAVWFAVRFVHHRPFVTVITGKARFSWRVSLQSGAVAMGLMALYELGHYAFYASDYAVVFDAGRFLLFLPFVVVLLPLQVMAEEILFRGYILQLLGRFTRSRFLIVGVAAAIFASAHLLNAEVKYGGVWAILQYAGVALYLTILAVRGNGLEHAFGVHLANNVFALSLFASAGSDFPAPTIFFLEKPNLAADLLGLALVCAAHYWFVFGRPAGSVQRTKSRAE